MIRITKIAAALFIGAIGLLFALANLFNLNAAYTVTSLVVSGAEQPAYQILGPVITAGWLTWIALFIIIAGELSVGILGFLGTFQMIRTRSAPAKDFDVAKASAVCGGALGMLIWYGLFIVIGEGYFQMWQTEVGLASVEGAFRYGTVSAVLAFYIGFSSD